ncbi:hypothetical protein [Ruegeria marina]|uniref:Uncharacterized protein n=1 Tax=Ruegeria marina TaxID=639004 RepID=A0A1G6Q5Y9_9RHOB|nr:hypothetical protein [Ruegeria marina]SDC87882.1 hypothetical protein SAMN04488239_10432 [Ruegeria marina]
MAERVVHHAEGLVRVTWQPELQAIYLKWLSEYDEGTRVRDAVLTALAWVRTNRVEHWVADVSTSPYALSDRDYEWVSGEEFRAAILDSPLRKFVLIPPLPDTGQDTAWVADWERNTLSRFGGRVSARVCATLDDARLFLAETVA